MQWRARAPTGVLVNSVMIVPQPVRGLLAVEIAIDKHRPTHIPIVARIAQTADRWRFPELVAKWWLAALVAVRTKAALQLGNARPLRQQPPDEFVARLTIRRRLGTGPPKSCRANLTPTPSDLHTLTVGRLMVRARLAQNLGSYDFIERRSTFRPSVFEAGHRWAAPVVWQ